MRLSPEWVEELVPGVLSSDDDDCCCIFPIMGDAIEDGDAAFVLPPLLLPGDNRGLSLSWIPCLINFLHFDLLFWNHIFTWKYKITFSYENLAAY